MNTQDKAPRLDWMKVGSIFAIDDEEKAEFISASNKVEWFDLPTGNKLPFSQGYAVQEMIKQFFGGKATAAGWMDTYRRYTLIAVRGIFTNGIAEAFAIDTGSELMPVLVKFYENN